jgi:hypothetical protein
MSERRWDAVIGWALILTGAAYLIAAVGMATA